MKTMKRTISRAVVLMVICILAVLSCSAAFADGESMTFNGKTRRVYWRTNGNGEEVSVFQVAVTKAPGTVYFYQEEGLCYEDSITHYIDGKNGKEEEWGKYHIYYRLIDSNNVRCVDWDKTRRGSEFELYLNNTGIYYIWVVPYTAQEMTNSWTLDTFISWNKAPYWRVYNWSNGISGICGDAYQLKMNGCYDTRTTRLNIRDAIR